MLHIGTIDSNRLKNMKRIIFLDIDGVLNSGRWFAKTGGEPDAEGMAFHLILLQSIVSEELFLKREQIS